MKGFIMALTRVAINNTPLNYDLVILYAKGARVSLILEVY